MKLQTMTIQMMNASLAFGCFAVFACFDVMAQAGAKVARCDIMSLPSQAVQFSGHQDKNELTAWRNASG